MNKLAKTLCMMAVVALAFTACKKNDADTKAIPFNASTQTFVQDNENPFEKVYLNNGNVAFESGDNIMLFNIKANPTTSAPSQADMYTVQPNLVSLVGSGTLDGTTDGNYYAFYPGQVVSGSDLLASNRSTFTLAATQSYPSTTNPNFDANFPLPANCLYMAAKDLTHTDLTQTVYDFQNICGILSFSFFSPSGKSVASIEVTDKSFNLVGDVTLRLDKVDPVYMTTLFNNYSDDAAYQTELQNYLFGADGIEYAIANASPTVTLQCGTDGVALGTTQGEATRFFIVMRPLALLNGFDAVITFTDGTDYQIHSTRNNVIKPNQIRCMIAINVG